MRFLMFFGTAMASLLLSQSLAIAQEEPCLVVWEDGTQVSLEDLCNGIDAPVVPQSSLNSQDSSPNISIERFSTRPSTTSAGFRFADASTNRINGTSRIYNRIYNGGGSIEVVSDLGTTLVINQIPISFGDRSPSQPSVNTTTLKTRFF